MNVNSIHTQNTHPFVFSVINAIYYSVILFWWSPYIRTSRLFTISR